MKMTRKIIGVIALVATIMVIGCKDDDHRESRISNQEFVDKASSSNMFEIAAGELALAKSSNADVRAYGEHMVNDHTAAAEEMKNLADRKGWVIPTRLMEKEQNNLNRLIGLDAANFDKEFANMMVISHQDAINLFETAAADFGVPDQDLRNMASGKLPTLKHHLEDANGLKAKVNP